MKFHVPVQSPISCARAWLENKTRLTTLNYYGEIIPSIGFMQTHEPMTRKIILDRLLDNWINLTGYYPKGLFCFQPDTFVVNYLEESKISYLQGYCFDQYLVDYMTMRGGWQLPYYASSSHVLKPNEEERGVVILPHVTWDWGASFTESHELNTQIYNLKSIFKGNMTMAENYFYNLVDETLRGSKPLGFVSIQFEWCWAGLDGNMKDYAKNWIMELLKKRDCNFWSYGAFSDWFIEQYKFTPEYSVNFVSPYSKQKIEWFFNRSYRIARMENRIVSYIKYQEQTSDKYLETCEIIDMANPSSTENSIDNSLEFTVDALGGGAYRAGVNGESLLYEGNLDDFKIP